MYTYLYIYIELTTRLVTSLYTPASHQTVATPLARARADYARAAPYKTTRLATRLITSTTIYIMYVCRVRVRVRANLLLIKLWPSLPLGRALTALVWRRKVLKLLDPQVESVPVK